MEIKEKLDRELRALKAAMILFGDVTPKQIKLLEDRIEIVKLVVLSK